MKNLSVAVTLVFCCVMFAIVGFARAGLANACSKLDAETLKSQIPNPETVRLVSLGYENLLADLYWLAFINYIGDGAARSADDYELAERYLLLVNRLDPQFVAPYWFAAFIIGGDAKRPRQSSEIIDFGIQHNPENWCLPFIAGINQYLYAHNEVMASKYYRMAARYPDAPQWLARQATVLDSKAPRLVKEAYSWLEIYNSSNEPEVKSVAKERAIWLWVQVYKNAPNDVYRQKAKVALASLDVDVNMFTKLKN